MKIAIGSDHTGVYHKNLIIEYLNNKGYNMIDFGSYSSERKVDYPDFIHPTVNSVENEESLYGIIICGSGNGAAMTANKHPNIRAALVWKKEIASLARKHNDANILSLPARFLNKERDVLEIVDIFLNTDFQGGRHKKRIEKISIYK
ncbi:RpiB/LacA/LacB family sugar-phosphate isomerase [Blattabacterium cuenoti]|uniref:RpiB/LacA/LacB family sugar-phosphate isomerase n=1 Tax=Blattabacterium cuenoti TaxID=1653831 RepID=UPI00163CC074|nr:RpiB/LacA/LacB family sugar-phosphate isomerase [Blattabacterium cuenoti]